MRPRWMRASTIAAAVALAAGACGSNEPSTLGPSTTTTGVTGNIAVFAAASLTESFTEIGKEFEAANPGSKVTFNFGGSSALATQINEGAPADVFASASPATMKIVTDAGNADGTPACSSATSWRSPCQGQPEGDQGPGRPHQAGRQGRAVRRAGALRCGGQEGAGRGRRGASRRSPWSRTSRPR